ncbi:uncharacterized protein LOC125369762 [Ricinus communis]|uniref:uncharacterized protein LOC125369762 n=1 Tax=Ricinus communis TaxID=3988 RepID=UPI00201A580C|nr:uncharacterized protein LOC125369762 [Ricinus communis]
MARGGRHSRACLDKAAKCMKKWPDVKKRSKEYNVGDLVMVKLLPNQFKSLRQVHKGLVRRYKGPFPIVKRVGAVAYQLQLPSKLKIHNVFHVSMLKPYHEDKEDPSCGESKRAPMAIVTKFDKEIECILADRVIRRRGVPNYTEYLVKSGKICPTSRLHGNVKICYGNSPDTSKTIRLKAR